MTQVGVPSLGRCAEPVPDESVDTVLLAETMACTNEISLNILNKSLFVICEIPKYWAQSYGFLCQLKLFRIGQRAADQCNIIVYYLTQMRVCQSMKLV